MPHLLIKLEVAPDVAAVDDGIKVAQDDDTQHVCRSVLHFPSCKGRSTVKE